MTDLFESAWRKFVRGFFHGYYLQIELSVFNSEGQRRDRLSVVTLPGLDGRSMEVWIERADSLPSYWASVVADAASNFRSALDHLAWALVTRGSTPPSSLSETQQRQIQFPLLRAGETARAVFPRRVPGISSPDAEILERYQPVDSQGADIPGHYLGVLAELNNADKHRAARPVVGLVSGGELEFTALVDCTPIGDSMMLAQRPSMAAGELLARIPVRVTGPHPSMKVRPNMHLGVMVWDDVELGRWLRVTAGQIRRLLLEFGPMPDLTGWMPDRVHPGPSANAVGDA